MTNTTNTKGLENVIAAESALTDIDGTAGTLHYAGYDIHDLVQRASFEDIVELLWDGALPDVAQREAFRQAVNGQRSCSVASEGVLRALPVGTSPMSALRTAVSALAGQDSESEQIDLASARRIALLLLAQMPTLLAAFGRIRQNLEPIAPRDDLGHAANLLWMYHGTEPDPTHVAALNTYLVLLAEHSLNASTFAARVVIGALGDVYGAVTAAIATLNGAAHGGANRMAYEMLEAMGDATGVKGYVDESFRIKRRIMGVGHRIYKVEDPRVRHLRSYSEQINISGKAAVIHHTAEALADLIATHPYFVERRLAPNVEFYSAPLLGGLGFPADMFPALFACSRIAGWSAHIFEQLQDNRLIRPKAVYVGPPPRELSLPV